MSYPNPNQRQQAVYATPPLSHHQHPQHQHRVLATHPYGVKRARYEEPYSLPYTEEQPFDQSPTTVVRPVPSFQIRHRSSDKTRGLRHFAHKVCEKVKDKVHTNYNEVADELVTEYFDQLVDIPTDPEKFQYDTRNIRRRVYDALNVLMAMNIIEKEKKEIRWVGLPTSSLAECRRLEEERAQRQERIRQKTEQLQELIVQLVAYKSLVQRNRERERLQGRPADSSILYLPYIIVSTDKKTTVDCAIAPDKSEYWFNFDRPFEIHDDIEVLKRLGLAYGIDRGEVQAENVPHIKACLPPALRDYVDQILEGTLNTRIASKQPAKPEYPQGVEGDKKSLIKSETGASAIKVAPADSIVVRATRANLSGIAPFGDGGPMGSFLGPVSSAVNASAQVSIAQAPVARYAVIPRPASARYTGRYPPMVQQQQHFQHPYQRGGTRLGGILSEYDDQHLRDQFHPVRHHPQQERAGMYMREQEELLDYPLEEYGPGEEGGGGHLAGEQIVVQDEEVVTEEGHY